MNILDMPIDQIMIGFGAPSALCGGSELNAIDRLNMSNAKINTVVTAFIEAIYQVDNYGSPIMYKGSGHFHKGVLCPLADRYPALTREEKKRLRERIEKLGSKGKSSLVRYDKKRKCWVLNRMAYPTIEKARRWAEMVQFPTIQQQF